jgi:hypothetical protein
MNSNKDNVRLAREWAEFFRTNYREAKAKAEHRLR